MGFQQHTCITRSLPYADISGIAVAVSAVPNTLVVKASSGKTKNCCFKINTKTEVAVMFCAAYKLLIPEVDVQR